MFILQINLNLFKIKYSLRKKRIIIFFLIYILLLMFTPLSNGYEKLDFIPKNEILNKFNVYYSDMNSFYFMATDGVGDGKIFSDESNSITWPMLSFGCEYLAYVRIGINKNELILFNLKEKSIFRKIQLQVIKQFSWSKSGDKILFIGSKNTKDFNLYIFNIEYEKLKKINTNIPPIVSRHLSPPIFLDGDNEILYSGNNGYIYQYNIKNNIQQLIIKGKNPIILNKNKILYEKFEGHYFLLNIKSGEENLILDNIKNGIPVIFPNTNFIIYPNYTFSKIFKLLPFRHEKFEYLIYNFKTEVKKKIHSGYAEFCLCQPFSEE